MKFERIRNLREDNDYKQETIAKLLCITQSTYSDYENGIVSVPIDSFIKLAEFYNTSIDYLAGLTGNPQSYERERVK